MAARHWRATTKYTMNRAGVSLIAVARPTPTPARAPICHRRTSRSQAARDLCRDRGRPLPARLPPCAGTGAVTPSCRPGSARPADRLTWPKPRDSRTGSVASASGSARPTRTTGATVQPLGQRPEHPAEMRTTAAYPRVNVYPAGQVPLEADPSAHGQRGEWRVGEAKVDIGRDVVVKAAAVSPPLHSAVIDAQVEKHVTAAKQVYGIHRYIAVPAIDAIRTASPGRSDWRSR